ncbi:Crp/Fnr family transcriptional regulator [Kineobactrum salinum]|uniref:Crp/Fnr family transcriptional regulator n=1 Tax=Kineobactrum salinum TaxID=2708301 RepID=A0A6C0U0E2_9GAMM|nr:Crp/Fnr family transcriptional regulator [Kineobactrum salinum]QIB65378.1 Crp/Fnr family transcriptional regulator [Kineobactrum salinum]
MQITFPLNARPVLGQNQLLASLSSEAKRRIVPSLERVSFALGEVVYEAGDAERFVYFPNDCILSLLYVMENGKSTEISVIGNDGILGTTALLGEGLSWSQAVVQNAGSAYRMPGPVLQEELHRHSELRWLTLRYMQSAMAQTAQVAACNRHHSIAQQLCRKLLFSLDRVAGDELTLTQEVIANTLGVRREGVTEAAGMLREMGAIDYRRGRIKVLDRARLEQLSCECYAALNSESKRILPCEIAPAAAHESSCATARSRPSSAGSRLPESTLLSYSQAARLRRTGTGPVAR